MCAMRWKELKIIALKWSFCKSDIVVHDLTITTKSKVSWHKASDNIYQTGSRLLIGFLDIPGSPDHLPPECSQLSKCPINCELEPSFMWFRESKTIVWIWLLLNELIMEDPPRTIAVATFCKEFPQIANLGFLWQIPVSLNWHHNR